MTNFHFKGIFDDEADDARYVDVMSMNEHDFQASLSRSEPPVDASPALRALWFDARGDWGRAHGEVQDGATASGCHVHGYLHRKEGDTANAGYWYRRAAVAPATGSLDAEWNSLVRKMLNE